MGMGVYGFVSLAVRAHPDRFFLELLNHVRIVKDLLLPAVKVPVFCHLRLYKPVSVFPVFKLGCSYFFQGLSIPCSLDKHAWLKVRFPYAGIIKPCHCKDYACINIRQSTLNCITSFKHGHIRGKFLIQFRVSLCGKAHICERVGIMVILSCRIQDKFGLEVLKNRKHQSIKHVKYSFIRGTGRQGNIDCPSKGFWASQFIYEARTRVKGPSVLVEGDKKHIRIIIENLLGSIPMMHISIHNCNPADPVFFPQVLDEDSFVIDIAKSPVPMCYSHCMVARRADKRKSVFDLGFHQGIPKHQATASCDQVRGCSLGFYIRHTEMNSGNIPVLRKARFIFGYFWQVHQALFKDLVSGIEKALFSFWMGWRNCPVKGREENKSCLIGSSAVCRG